MSQYKPYPAYKDSGVEWLGNVPEHWSVERIGHRFQLRNGFPFDSEKFGPEGEQHHRLVRIRDLSLNANLIYTDEFCPEDALVADGDVLIGMDGDFNAVIWSGGVAKLNQRVCALRGSSDPETKFLLYSLFKPLKIINDTAYSTTVKHLSSGEVLFTRLSVPPEAELRAVVHHLDRETARIDGLVGRKTRFIELLREKRQALITRAVTKGLDPGAKMKDSGVEWLGEVPEHWDVTPLKYLASFRSGGTPSKDNLQFWDGVIPWASAKDLKKDQLYDTEDHITDFAVESGAASLVPAGSVLVVVRGMILARLFPVVEAMVPMAINQDLKALQASKKLNGHFLAYLLRGLADQSLRRLEEAGHGTKALRMEAWTSMQLTVPPLEEQREVISFIVKETTRIATLISKTETSIALLRERRSALITAAVTGRIDLRDASAAQAVAPEYASA